jgi:predicted Rossmann fold nucleotide-binding protein DprA/Smf involved in DNA uptake
MKLAIIGSRNFNDYEALSLNADILSPSEIVSGGAKGADSLAEKYAVQRNLPVKVFLPKFKTDRTVKYHPRWFLERNKEIVEYSDTVLAFWDGKSKGTAHTIQYAEKIGRKVIVIMF